MHGAGIAGVALTLLISACLHGSERLPEHLGGKAESLRNSRHVSLGLVQSGLLRFPYMPASACPTPAHAQAAEVSSCSLEAAHRACATSVMASRPTAAPSLYTRSNKRMHTSPSRAYAGAGGWPGRPGDRAERGPAAPGARRGRRAGGRRGLAAGAHACCLPLCLPLRAAACLGSVSASSRTCSWYVQICTQERFDSIRLGSKQPIQPLRIQLMYLVALALRGLGARALTTPLRDLVSDLNQRRGCAVGAARGERALAGAGAPAAGHAGRGAARHRRYAPGRRRGRRRRRRGPAGGGAGGRGARVAARRAGGGPGGSRAAHRGRAGAAPPQIPDAHRGNILHDFMASRLE